MVNMYPVLRDIGDTLRTLILLTEHPLSRNCVVHVSSSDIFGEAEHKCIQYSEWLNREAATHRDVYIIAADNDVKICALQAIRQLVLPQDNESGIVEVYPR